MRRALVITALAGWLALAATVESTLGTPVLTNGDFSQTGSPPDPFAFWTTFGGDYPTDGGGFALFSESTSFAQTELEQTFNLTPGSTQLSFEFLLSTVQSGSAGTPPDSFQATLYDLSFNPYPPATPPLLPAFYSINATGDEYYDTNFVSVMLLGNGWTRVTLDISSLPSQDMILEFILNGSDDNRTTTVSLDNVAVTASAVPEPGYLLPLLATGLGYFATRRRRRSPSEVQHQLG